MLHDLSVTALCSLAPLAAQCIALGPFASRGALPSNLAPVGSATATSGLAASRHDPGLLWCHDDGDVGHLPQLFALRADGSLRQRYTLSGVTNRDWEDVALGPGPIPGRDYLYLAETGNNALTFTSLALIRVAEPDVPATAGATIALAAETFAFRYPSGTFNCETLWLDPLDGTPWLLTKENATTCSLFRYPLPLDSSVEKTLVRVRTLTGMPRSFTGGAVSQDGRVVSARTTGAVYAWMRATGAAFESAFDAPPCLMASTAQGQAEAIALSADGRTLWAVSEGAGATLWAAPVTHPAGVPVAYAFGSGMAASGSVPGLGATHAPRLGGPPVGLGVWQAAPLSPAVALLSTTGLPDGAAAFAGGWLHALPDVIVPLTVDAQGLAALVLPALPDIAALWGLSLHGQALIADAGAPLGIALSAGLRLVFDR